MNEMYIIAPILILTCLALQRLRKKPVETKKPKPAGKPKNRNHMKKNSAQFIEEFSYEPAAEPKEKERKPE